MYQTKLTDVPRDQALPHHVYMWCQTLYVYSLPKANDCYLRITPKISSRYIPNLFWNFIVHCATLYQISVKFLPSFTVYCSISLTTITDTATYIIVIINYGTVCKYQFCFVSNQAFHCYFFSAQANSVCLCSLISFCSLYSTHFINFVRQLYSATFI